MIRMNNGPKSSSKLSNKACKPKSKRGTKICSKVNQNYAGMLFTVETTTTPLETALKVGQSYCVLKKSALIKTNRP